MGVCVCVGGGGNKAQHVIPSSRCQILGLPVKLRLTSGIFISEETRELFLGIFNTFTSGLRYLWVGCVMC